MKAAIPIAFLSFLLGCGNRPGLSTPFPPDHAAATALIARAPLRGDPGARGYPVLIDTPRGVLMVGGQQGAACWTSNLTGNGGVWLFEPGPSRWTQLAAEAAHQADSAAYNSRTGELIVRFSAGKVAGTGCDFLPLPEPISETWAFDWRKGSWTNLAPRVSPPSLVSAAAPIVYDPRADKIIFFGGLDLVKFQQLIDGQDVDPGSWDTWAYDRSSNSWTNMHPAGQPTARNAHALAYDERTGRVIMFGGAGAGDDLNDTWAYDYATNTWTNLAPTVSPSGRHYAQLAYDPSAKRMVLYGGVDTYETVAYQETWLYDPASNTWEQIHPDPSPNAGAWFGLTFSERTDALILYGGGPARGEWSNEVWSFRTKKATWTRVETR